MYGLLKRAWEKSAEGSGVHEKRVMGDTQTVPDFHSHANEPSRGASSVRASDPRGPNPLRYLAFTCCGKCSHIAGKHGRDFSTAAM